MRMNHVRFSGRLTIEVSALVGAGNIGNYNQIATAKIAIPTGHGIEVFEGVPIITGNSLKHWHAVYMAQAYKDLGGTYMNALCEKGIGLRGYKHTSRDLSKKLETCDSECEAILDLCNDVHGFLIPGKQLKRDSLVQVSNMIPVLTRESLEAVSKFAVQHNRVVPPQQIKGEEKEERAGMMVFKQEYASVPLFGFAMSIDLSYILRPRYEDGECLRKLKVFKDDRDVESERVKRAKASILAVLNMMLGSGSKQARALPITEVRELVAAASEASIPNTIHGAYPGYLSESIDSLKTYAKLVNKKIWVLCYGVKEDQCVEEKSDTIEIRRVKSLEELFGELMKLLSV